MKQLATNLDNGMIIEVVSRNGGWTTCRDIEKGFEFKLRNGKVGEYCLPTIGVQEPKAESIEPAKSDEPAKAEYLHPAEVCPVCGSKEVFHGFATEAGEIINEETDWGCHHCDFEMHIADFPELAKDKLIKADLEHYVKGAGVTNSGRPTVDIDDVVAKALRGDDLEVLYPRVAAWLQLMGRETIGRGSKKMEVTEENLRQRYSRLNVGMQRMNLGNILRGALNDLGLTELPKIED